MRDVFLITSVLVAVNDSAAALAAVEVAVALAAREGAQLHAVTVVDPVSTFVDGHQAHTAPLVRQSESEADALLRHVVVLGSSAGLVVGTRRRAGRVAAEILDEASLVAADLIVMASVDRPGHAVPKVGSHTMRVLEFASIPVLVVPGRAAGPELR